LSNVEQLTPFDREEYADRLARVLARMEDAELDALVVAEPANIAYLTGYDAWSWYTPQAVLVARSLPEPMWVGRDQDVACAHWATYLSDASIIGYPDEYITDTSRHGMDFVARVLREHGLEAARIGVEEDAIPFTPRAAQSLRAGLPNATIQNADLLVNWARTTKSDAEVDVMRQAAELALAGMSRAAAEIAPGARECDAAAAIYASLVAGSPDFAGSAPMRPTMPAGPRTDTPHLSWTDAVYEPGSPVNVELGGSRHNYHVGLSRTLYLGTPPGDLRRLADATHEAFQAMLPEIRPGRTCHEVQATFQREISRHGYEKRSRCGYSIGIGFPSAAWIERTASLMEGDQTVLEPNMTFHVVLGMWHANTSFMFSETVVVTASGCERLAPFGEHLILRGA
jgi:Xaa-Pro aminopeptidase